MRNFQDSRYFLMTAGYCWREVSREHYDRPPPEFISNKAAARFMKDGACYLEISAKNITPDDLTELASILQS